ncbi:MAG: nucleotide exchange factor GrpE [Deltaproteobacteria bacterium]|nr:nucleotide exchange factor GrpE [Deltaproteobacteria bacterium]
MDSDSKNEHPQGKNVCELGKKPESSSTPEKPEYVLKKKKDEEDWKLKYEKAATETKENFEKWLYLRAEFENFKKRIEKEKQVHIKYGIEHFAKELLSVVDNLERALSFTEKENHEKLKEGIELTLKECLKVLEKFGINPIESLGMKFNPQVHDAVLQEESDAEAGTILREEHKGYLLHDRLLRSAKVIVAKPKSLGTKGG